MSDVKSSLPLYREGMPQMATIKDALPRWPPIFRMYLGIVSPRYPILTALPIHCIVVRYENERRISVSRHQRMSFISKRSDEDLDPDHADRPPIDMIAKVGGIKRQETAFESIPPTVAFSAVR